MSMSEDDFDSIEEIFAKEMAAKIAARAELEEAEPEVPKAA